MVPVVVLLHIGEAYGDAYAAPLGAAWRSFVLGAGSGAYGPDGGLAGRYATLRAFLEAEVPEWRPGAPLVLACWSAGCWAPRTWMRQESSRSIVSALVLLDGLHSGFSPEGACKTSAVDGIMEYGWLAASRPSEHCLVLTHSEIVPPGYASTTQCARLVDRELPYSSAIHIWGEPGDDAAAHMRQVQVVGPWAMEHIVAPRLRPVPAATQVGVVLATFGLTAAAVILAG